MRGATLPVLELKAPENLHPYPCRHFTFLGFSSVRKDAGTLGLGISTPRDTISPTPPLCDHSAETAHFWSKTHVFARMAPLPVLALKVPETRSPYPWLPAALILPGPGSPLSARLRLVDNSDHQPPGSAERADLALTGSLALLIKE